MLGGLGSDHRARCGEGEEMDPSNLSLQCGGANWPRSAEFKFHHKENRMHEETIDSLSVNEMRFCEDAHVCCSSLVSILLQWKGDRKSLLCVSALTASLFSAL